MRKMISRNVIHDLNYPWHTQIHDAYESVGHDVVVSYAGCSRYSTGEEDIFLFEKRRNARSASKINASWFWLGLRDHHQINIKAFSFFSRSLNHLFFSR